MIADPIISCTDLSKSFSELQALKRINLDILKGEVFGVIGPDGAGKTTLFRLIASLMIPDEGSVSVLGYDSVKDYREIRKNLGYMPGRFSLYPDLSVEENLNFYAAVYGSSIKENYHLIESVYSHIEPFKKRRAGKLSGGMKQKLALSCALIHSPKILILDEPTTGVDAVSRREFWEMLKELKNKGITVLVSTPYMDEARRCDRIALFQKGEILKIDTPELLVKQLDISLFAVRSVDKQGVLSTIRSSQMVNQAYMAGQLVHYTSVSGGIEEMRKYLQDKGFKDFEIMIIEPDIEDCFIHLMTK